MDIRPTPEKFDSVIPSLDSIDLTNIGVNCVINDSVIDYDYILSKILTINNTNIQFNVYNGEILDVNGVFECFGKEYTILNKLAEGGFGIICSIISNDRHYVLKIQPLNRMSSEDSLKEVLIQHIVYETTKQPNHTDCVYVPQIYAIFKLNIPIRSGKTNRVMECLCSIHEKLDTTFKNYIELCNRDYKSTKIVLIQIARKLHNLWRLYNFNHCDLHADNIMCNNMNSTPSWRLIDFGNARLQFSNQWIHPDYTETDTNEGHDFSELMRSLVKDTKQIGIENDIPKYMARLGSFNEENICTYPSNILDIFNTIPYITDSNCSYTGGFVFENRIDVNRNSCVGMLYAASVPNGVLNYRINSLGNTRKNRTKNQYTRKNTNTITPNFVKSVSIENIYNIIRFNLFPEISEDLLKDIFVHMAYIPLKHPKILPSFCTALSGNKISNLTRFVEKYYKPINIEKVSHRQVDMNRIFDLYFTINNKNAAQTLLMHLLLLDCEQSAYDAHLERLENADMQTRLALLPSVVWNSIRI